MQDDNPNKADLNWSPPSPPWKPEPEPLELNESPDETPEEEETVTDGASTIAEGFNQGISLDSIPTPLLSKILSEISNGVPVSSDEFSEFDSKDNGIRVGDFFFYMIMSPQGITRNGVFYDIGGHWFDEETYGSIEIIDLPFQE